MPRTSETISQGQDIAAIIPVTQAGICVNCETVFTIIGHSSCPGCGSTAWAPLQPWLNSVAGRRIAG